MYYKILYEYKKEVIIIRTKLTEYRKQLGFTQEMLAKETKSTKQLISNIENGTRNGTIKFWILLQKCLCLSNDEVMEFIKEGIDI